MKRLLVLFFCLFSIATYPKSSASAVYNVSSFDEPAVEVSLLAEEKQEDIHRRSYASAYFSNLNNNFPVNSHGTCSFTSLSMLLSYYDSFWGEAFVDDRYEEQSHFVIDESFGDRYGPGFCTESPGVTPEPLSDVSSLSYSQYFAYSKAHRDIYLQSALISTASDVFGWPISGNIDNPFALSFSQMERLISRYRCSDGSLLTDKMRFIALPKNYDSYDVETFVCEAIETGNPVLLNVVVNPNSDHEYRHTVLAYDFLFSDARKDIYVHPGWHGVDGRKALTHVSLKQLSKNTAFSAKDFLGDCVIESALRFERLSNWEPSENYIDNYGCSYAPQGMFYPHNLRQISANYLDYQPVFEWDSLEAEEWRGIFDVWSEVTLLNAKYEVLDYRVYRHGDRGYYSIPMSAWKRLLLDTSSEYYILIYLRSNEYGLGEEASLFRTFKKPSHYSSANHFESKLLGLGPSRESNATFHIGNFNFDASWRGCSKKPSGNLIISANEKSPSSYFEFSFDRPILRMDIYASILLPNKLSSVGVYVAREKEEEWELAYSNLPNSDVFETMWREMPFNTPVKMIRIVVRHALWPFIEKPKTNSAALLDVAEFAFWDRLPVSGFEAPYEPETWNKLGVVDVANCYAYALDCQVSLNDGKDWRNCPIGGAVCGKYNGYTSAETMREGMKIDFGFFFGVDPEGPEICKYVKEVGRFDLCPDGMYKVVCFYTEGKDYHWYRQNPDGFWSHKNGFGEATDRDFSPAEERIIDPLLCERGAVYQTLLGYFAVRPFGVHYEG